MDFVANETIYMIQEVNDFVDLVQSSDFGKDVFTIQQHAVGMAFRDQALLVAVVIAMFA